MKRKCVKRMVWIFMLFFTVSAGAQDAVKLKSVAAPISIAVGRYKATNLIFPFGIKSAYWVNKDLSVLQIDGLENVLMVNARNDSLKETNLTVATNDGSLYSFNVSYTTNPNVLNLKVNESGSTAQASGLLSPDDLNEVRINSLAERLATKKAVIGNIRDRNFDIAMELTGIYVDGDVLYFQLALMNNSNLRYTVDQLRFFIRDQKKSKRTSSQEVQVIPLFVFGNRKMIEPQSSQVLVYAIEKFTIPLNQSLNVQLLEKNGGRNVSIKIGNRSIIKAKPVN
ncbi:Bacteroides conjugative transposon TraN protein [Chitinophaga niabensis]|uniref:Bacteroides conjugative transposon TraN protein n=2 Tax=Chitinophaga niabensis TaxID=536979 RepID=A0A1N6E576_9BACT|nr:Bacteroides conjugative transposon TraN protein [Chitinophaga niabensis]